MTALSVVSGYLPAILTRLLVYEMIWLTLPVLYHSVWNMVSPSKTSNSQQTAADVLSRCAFSPLLCCFLPCSFSQNWSDWRVEGSRGTCARMLRGSPPLEVPPAAKSLHT